MIGEKSHLPVPEWNTELLTVEMLVTCFAAVNLIELEKIYVLQTKCQ